VTGDYSRQALGGPHVLLQPCLGRALRVRSPALALEPALRAQGRCAQGCGARAVAVAAHPGAKVEQVVVQRQLGLPDLRQRGVDAPVEHRQRREDGLVEVRQPLPHLRLRARGRARPSVL